MDVNCLDCGALLFEKVPFDSKGNWVIQEGTDIPLEEDETDSFYRCPYCSAKNLVIETTSSTGPLTLEIVRAKKD